MDLFKKSISELWAKHKLFLIVFGVLILVIKFKEFFIDLLVDSVKKEVDKTEKKDTELLLKQEKANNESDRLKEEALSLDSNKPSVDEDWHKKK